MEILKQPHDKEYTINSTYGLMEPLGAERLRIISLLGQFLLLNSTKINIVIAEHDFFSIILDLFFK